VLPTGSTSIGRQADNDLVLVHPLVSRHHARLECTAETCHVTDLGSTHGTMVNRERLTPQAPVLLNDGDVVEIGPFRLVYAQVVYHEAPAGQGIPTMAEAGPPAGAAGAAPGEGQTDGSTAMHQAVFAAAPLSAAPVPNGEFGLPPGLSYSSSSYLEYLPDIYNGESNRFIPRFLALLESILAPIEWNINNFDLYLDPKTAPFFFLPWLADWFEWTFDESWSEESRRRLLTEAHQIHGRKGTAWALCRILEIYTGKMPEIDDQNKNLDPFTFTVKIPISEQQAKRSVIEQIIDANKPAHTSYSLIFGE
jgi:phage tail-like protein